MTAEQRTEYHSVELLERLERVVEREDLCGAYKREVHGVKEQHNPAPVQRSPPSSMLACSPFAEVVGEGDILEEAVDNGGGLEGRGGLLNDGDHGGESEREQVSSGDG